MNECDVCIYACAPVAVVSLTLHSSGSSKMLLGQVCWYIFWVYIVQLLVIKQTLCKDSAQDSYKGLFPAPSPSVWEIKNLCLDYKQQAVHMLLVSYWWQHLHGHIFTKSPLEPQALLSYSGSMLICPAKSVYLVFVYLPLVYSNDRLLLL